MRDFISEIKRINTDGVIFELSKASIDMFQKQRHKKIFKATLTRFGFQKKVNVPLFAWDIQAMAYLAVLHSNDYRREKNLPRIECLISLYRAYENENSIAEDLRGFDIDHIFRAILGMSAEQFQYENISWIFEKFNRDYYILLAASNFEHRSLIDAEAAVGATLNLSPNEYIIGLLMAFGLSKINPIPLGWYDLPEAADLPQIISKETVQKIIAHYSCIYEELRASPFGKQLLYAKPFIKTQNEQIYISCNVFLVAMLLGNGLYWLIRDYYRDEKQTFPNAFGLLFEDYIKDLGSRYCKEDEWGIIPKSKRKGADFFFDIGEIRILVEAKSALLQLSARQQVPDMNAVDDFFSRHIRKSYKQLNNSLQEMTPANKRPTIKTTLLYDDFSNTSIIEQSMSDIYTDDPFCYVMTIRELEILLYSHKHDKEKCGEFCDRVVNNTRCAEKRASIGAILEEIGLVKNHHLEGEMDYFKTITEQLGKCFG